MRSFPVTESTLSASQLGNLIIQRYQLPPVTACRLLRTGMNHLYLVRSQPASYVFRVYTLDWRTKTEISEEIRLLNHLRQEGVHVSYPIHDSSGSFIQELDAPEGLRYGVMFSFAEGAKNPRFSAQDSEAIGKEMAMMHKGTEGFAIQRITYDTRTMLDESLVPALEFFGSDSPELKFVIDLSASLKTSLRPESLEGVRKGAVHLDIWFDNIHFDSKGGITIFDFDFCGNGLLVFDIAFFLYQLLSTHQSEEDYAAKADRFMNGYERVVRLSDSERKLIPAAALSVLLFYLGIQCRTFDNWSNVFLNEDHLRRYTGAMKRWMRLQNILSD